MASKEFRDFKVKDVSLKVRKPNIDEIREAQRIQTKAFHDALKNGAMLRAKLDDVLREQGLWDDQKEVELKTLQAEIAELEVKLLKGGIKISDGEKIAMSIISKRDRIKEIFTVKTIYDSKTAEALAEDAKIDYYLSVCLVYNPDENGPKGQYFKDLADYINQQNSEVAVEAYRQYLYLINDTEDNPEQELTEYKFLKKFKKVDEKLRLINKDGHLIDRDGRLINEDGRFINEKGDLVDINGNPVDESGNYKFDEQPFLDDNGNPVEVA
jgi:hypothetical protein